MNWIGWTNHGTYAPIQNSEISRIFNQSHLYVSLKSDQKKQTHSFLIGQKRHSSRIWNLYSLISMRPIYNFDTWAIIWHGVVCWFMGFSPFLPVLVCCDHKIVLHWYEISKQKQFSDHVAQIIVNPGTLSEIN